MVELEKKKKSRKKNGQGTIEKLKSGNVRIKVQIGVGEDKKPKFKSFSGKTIKAASALRDEYLSKQKKLTTVIDFQDQTLEDAVTSWMMKTKMKTVKNSTFDRMDSTFRVHIFPEFKYLTIRQIDAELVQELINAKMQDLSCSSVRKIYQALYNFYRYYENLRKINFNIMYAVIMPKASIFVKKTKKTHIISEEDVRRITTVALSCYANGKPKYIQGPAIIVLLHTGMRIGELLALEWGDVNFDKKEIQIYKTLIHKRLRIEDSSLNAKEKEALNKGEKNITKVQMSNKTDKDRIIYINKEVNEALMLLKSRNKKYVVETKSGSFVLPGTFTRTFKRIFKSAGASDNHPHATKHTYITKMLQSGIQVDVLSKLVGTSAKVIFETYNSVIAERAKKAAINTVDLYGIDTHAEQQIAGMGNNEKQKNEKK